MLGSEERHGFLAYPLDEPVEGLVAVPWVPRQLDGLQRGEMSGEVGRETPQFVVHQVEVLHGVEVVLVEGVLLHVTRQHRRVVHVEEAQIAHALKE